jgi:tRNA pseudouridine55 synthase
VDSPAANRRCRRDARVRQPLQAGGADVDAVRRAAAADLSRSGGKLAVGHLGTLDPQAAGVLPIALGKATRLLPLIEDRRKGYVCTLVLGRATATGDGSGETFVERAVPSDIDARLEAALPAFVGADRRCRRCTARCRAAGGGCTSSRAPGRRSNVRRARSRSTRSRAGARRRRRAAAHRVQRGTYVRTLCEDLALACGTVGHMGALLRDASGPFVLYESRTLDEVERDPGGALVPPERVIPIPTVVLDGRLATDFRAGRLVPLAKPPADKHVFVRDSARALVGVGETVGALLAPRKVFL